MPNAVEIKGVNFSWGLQVADKEDEDEDKTKDKKAEERKEDLERKLTVSETITLNGIELSVKQGEFVCIIGDVGSGKSSLLSAINGDMLQVSGEFIEQQGGLEKELGTDE